MVIEFVGCCLEIASHQVHQAIVGSHHRGRSSAQTILRWCVRQVAETRRRHHLTDLSVAAALGGHLAGLPIVAKVLPMVLSAAAAAVAAVAELAAEEVGVLVTVVFVEELAAGWVVAAAVRVADGECCCSSLIDQHCSLVVGRPRAMENH